MIRAARLVILASCLLTTVTSNAPASPEAAYLTLHVAPDGNGTVCTAQRPCAIEDVAAIAHRKSQRGPSNVRILLANGRYALRRPIVLSADNAVRGTQTWQPEPGAAPVLDGSVPIRGWTRTDPAKNIWAAPLPTDSYSLQLYVDGRVAHRASRKGCGQTVCRYSSEGIVGAGSLLSDVRKPELVVAAIDVRWRSFRCGIKMISGTVAVMDQPCWGNTKADSKNQWSKASPAGEYYRGITAFENAYEFLGEPGGFFIDRSARRIFYVPRPGEDPRTADIRLPVLQTLFRIHGDRRRPVRGIAMTGLRFQHATWTYAEDGDGYVPLQAGYLLTGRVKALPDNGAGLTHLPAAVDVEFADDVTVTGNRFDGIGEAGLSLGRGVHHSSATRNTFIDLSGGGIYVGTTEAHPVFAGDQASAITVSYNVVRHVAEEYRDNVAIMSGYADDLLIEHNAIADLPYSGISAGWGWNYDFPRVAQRGVHIRYNRISHVMQALHDGAAIYTQGESPGSDVIGNYISYGSTSEGNGIYLDERSRHFFVCGNIVWNYVKRGEDEMFWLSAWATWSGDLYITGNYSDAPIAPLHNSGPTKVFVDNHLGLQSMTPDMQAIAAFAGTTPVGPPRNGCKRPPM